jgi:hypothetical protein
MPSSPAQRLCVILLTAFGAVAQAQQAPQSTGYAGPFGEEHAQEKRMEQIAIGMRVQQNLKIASDRKEGQYAQNRRRCQAALQVAELCGKFAGTFYCDEKGFQPIAAGASARAVAMDNVGRHKMERCALDAAKRNLPGG